MSDNFQIKVVSSTEVIKDNKILTCKSSLIYKGDDVDFFKYIEGFKSLQINTDKTIELAFVSITFFSDSAKLTPYEYEYIDETDSLKIVKYTTDSYNGILHLFYNYITKENLDKDRFPFLEQVKGISYGMLLCCICKGLKEGFLKSYSNIILECSGRIKGMDMKKSMINLVKNYEKIGFSQMFPEHYDYGIETTLVPMIGKVETLISRCTFENVSKELLEILPVKLCKNICDKEKLNKKVLKSIRKSLIGKVILSEHKDKTIPINILSERLVYLKKINRGFVNVSDEDFVLMCRS